MAEYLKKYSADFVLLEELWKEIEESELVGNDNEAIERLVKSQNVIVSRYNVIREEILKFLQTEIEQRRNCKKAEYFQKRCIPKSA